MKISQIKKSGRKIVKGNVKNSVKLLLLFAAGLLLLSVLPFCADLFLGEDRILTLSILGISLIMCAVFFAVFSTGSKKTFLFYNRKSRGVLSAFRMSPSQAVRITEIYIALLFKKLFWAALFTSPGIFMIAFSVFAAMNGGLEFNLFVSWAAGGAVLTAAGAVFLYVFLQRYFLVPYLRAADPSMKNRDIFSLSREYMSRGLGKTALLKISYLPWILLSLTVIPAAYVWSCYSQSCALMAYEVLKMQKE